MTPEQQDEAIDYNKSIYSFILGLIKDTKYIYTKDVNPIMLKSLAETHYGFQVLPITEWQLAFEWAITDTFGDGCEVETIGDRGIQHDSPRPFHARTQSISLPRSQYCPEL